MGSYPHAIENGAGEHLVFLRRTSDENGEYLEVENRVAPGSGPPMHVHFRQEEALTVRQGKIGYQYHGGEPQYAGVGETIAFKAGEPHRFWNAGEEDLHCTGYVRPPDNIEYFLTALYDSQKRNGGRRPDPFEAAYLTRRYRTEFAMLEIPRFVQRFIFPIQVGLGTVLGRYKRYADAPEPVKR